MQTDYVMLHSHNSKEVIANQNPLRMITEYATFYETVNMIYIYGKTEVWPDSAEKAYSPLPLHFYKR